MTPPPPPPHIFIYCNYDYISLCDFISFIFNLFSHNGLYLTIFIISTLFHIVTSLYISQWIFPVFMFLNPPPPYVLMNLFNHEFIYSFILFKFWGQEVCCSRNTLWFTRVGHTWKILFYVLLVYCSLMFRETVHLPWNVFHQNDRRWTFDITQSSARAPQ